MKLNLIKITTHLPQALPSPQFNLTLPTFFLDFAIVEVDKNQNTHAVPPSFILLNFAVGEVEVEC